MSWGDESYQTWINHAIISAVGTFLLSLVIPGLQAATYMPWAYAFREGDQQYKNWKKGSTINKLDAIMDVAAPTASALFVWWLL